MDEMNLLHNSILSIDSNRNSIIALLKGPDTLYKQILMNYEQQLNVPKINQDKNSFLQIQIRKLKLVYLVLFINFKYTFIRLY